MKTKSLLEFIRESTSLSRAEAYKLLGWSRQRYNGHMNNRYGERAKTLLLVARAWGIPQTRLSTLVGLWTSEHCLKPQNGSTKSANE